jgi:diguanylate cyclase (GGDEF)-like protein/PAS domain S-box-containing protein
MEAAPPESLHHAHRLFSKISFRLMVFFAYLFSALLFGALMLQELKTVDESTESVARERGYALFSLIELAREWNARHGGVYVPVTDTTQPNPYLKHPKRDLMTADGLPLTMINPAFMTRQLGELAALKNGTKLHITSLKPIRPANAADDWETESLNSFLSGSEERLSLISDGGTPFYRFMAPLYVKQACLKCHEVQGYKLGDLRGGISVAMPAQELLAVRHTQYLNTIWRYSGVALLVGILLNLLLIMMRRFVTSSARSSQIQEDIIIERTQSLNEKVKHLNQSNAQLENSHKTLSTILATTLDGYWCANTQGYILEVNDTYCAQSNYSRAELLTMHIKDLESKEAASDVNRHIKRILATGADQFETIHHRKDGSVWNVEVSTSYQEIDGGRFFVFLRDITERKKSENKIRQLAFYDTLTNLPNRRLLNERLDQTMAISKRSNCYGAVMFLDLDNFKPLNDVHGHLAGDLLLIEAAVRLKGCVRQMDTVARLGGDEFVILVTELDTDKAESVARAMVVAEKIRATLAETYSLKISAQDEPAMAQEIEHQCTVSIGVALFLDHEVSLTELLKLADQAMYQAKNKGRNRIELHSA